MGVALKRKQKPFSSALELGDPGREEDPSIIQLMTS